VKSRILNDACNNGEIEICKLLVEKVEEISIRPRVLIKHVKNNNFEMCKFIVEIDKEVIDGQEWGCRSGYGQGYMKYFNALMYCANDNRKEICALLIENGANLEIQTETGLTALMIASETGNLEICKMLLDAGANINFHYDPTFDESYKQFGAFNATPLTFAVFNEKYDVCKLLLDYGANVNIDNIRFVKKEKISNGTPICFTKNKEIISLLLDYGAEIEFSGDSISEESYEIIYDVIREKNQKRCKLIKEELMAYVWNPEREYTKWALLDELATPCGGAGF
jgi:hypothetical protein